MIKRNKRKKLWKRLLLVAGIVVLFLGAVAVALNYHWKPVLGQRIKNAIHTSTNGLYSIEFENIRVNILSGNIGVRNIRFIPDSVVFTTMLHKGTAPKHLYTVGVDELILYNVNPLKIYFDEVLEMSSVVIEKPKLDISFTNTVDPDTLKEDQRTAWQRLSPYLRSVKIQDITFRDADFNYIDHSVAPARITNLKGLTIKISDLLIDSASQYDQTRFYHTRDIYAELNNYRTVTADSNYTVQIGQFRASTGRGYAAVDAFRLIPRYGEMEFSERIDYQQDRYSIRVDELELEKIDFKVLNLQRRLIASRLTARNANAAIFLDRGVPDSLRDKGMNFPQLALKGFELNSRIDTLKLEDSRVDYSEYNPDSQRKGTVTFSKINGEIRNVSNDSLSLQRNHYADVDLTALLMDRGRFNLNMRFDLNAPQGDFDFEGNVGIMDADMFNTAIRPLSLIEIKSGSLERMDFNGSGSTRGVKGSLTCYYNDLKVSLLEISEETSWLKRRGIASMFANVLIIKSHNPMPREAVRSARFTYNRPPHSSFFNMIWKGMSGALLESIGFDAATRREISARLRRMEVERFEREERRDDRLRRREERRLNRN